MARQSQIPGGPYLNEDTTRQSQIPGWSFVNETFVSGATTITAAVGTFTLSGKDASFSKSTGNQTLTAQTATPFVVAGGNFTILRKGRQVTAAPATFVLSVAPSLSDVEHDVEKGAFTLTGNAAGLIQGYKITAALGTFTFTGNEVVLTPSATPVVLGAETGVFELVGNDATLSRESVTLTAETGEFVLTGIEIISAIVFSVETGEFVIDDKTASFTIGGRTRWTRRTTPVTGWQRRT
jgi:hypothetical protein